MSVHCLSRGWNAPCDIIKDGIVLSSYANEDTIFIASINDNATFVDDARELVDYVCSFLMTRDL